MAQKKAQKIQTNGHSWFPFSEELLDSPAYKALKPSAAKALPIFLSMPGRLFRARYGKPEFYSAVFAVTHSTGAKYGFANRTFARVIDELIRVGFIDPVEKGGLKDFGRSSSKFRISIRWRRYGCADFRTCDWKTFI